MKRNTPQRQAIVQVLSAARRPLKPEEILSRAQAIVPRLGIATVYRNLAKLTELGEIDQILLPNQKAHYEKRRRKRHHFFQCLRCHRVFDLEPAEEDFSELLPTGFTLEGYEVVLQGICEGCQDSGDDASA